MKVLACDFYVSADLSELWWGVKSSSCYVFAELGLLVVLFIWALKLRIFLIDWESL